MGKIDYRSVQPCSIWFAKFLGLAIGYRLPSDIRDAYVFLMNHYEPGDRLYEFGF